MVIGCGNQFFIDDKWVKLGSSANNSLDSTIRQLMVGYTNIENEDYDSSQKETKSTYDMIYDIEQLVRILNGPLPVYHPQFNTVFIHASDFIGERCFRQIIPNITER